MKSKPFTFKFDETTTSQIKKQYDAYVQFWSDDGCISYIFIGSFSVGHCTSKHLIDHFHKFVEELKVEPALLLHLGMDGPNVNLKFQRDLINYFESTYGTKFLDVDTLHKVYGSFKVGLQCLPFNLDQFAVELHGFLRCPVPGGKTIKV